MPVALLLWCCVNAAAPAAPAVERPAAAAALPLDAVTVLPQQEDRVAATVGRLLGEEDLLFLFQSFVALGVALGVGVLALVPANGIFLVLVFAALATQTPALLIAGPLVVLAVVLPLQAVGAGIAVWLVGLTSKTFQARGYMPSFVQRLLKDRGGNPDSMAAMGLLGAPWLTGTGGFLVGAGLGIAAALVLSLPLVAAAGVLVRAPPGGVSGVLAMTGALMLAAALVVAMPTLLAPPMAALAWHLAKEPLPESQQRAE